MKMTALFKKTLLIMVLIFGILAVATTLYSGWNLNASLTDEYRSKGMAIAKSIADSSVEILMNRDSSMAQSMIDQFLEIRGVKYIFILDGDNQIISHTFVPRVPAEAAALRSTARELSIQELEIHGLGSIMDISSPILAGVAGYVHVGMDRDLIQKAIFSAIVRQLSIVAVVFAISILLAFMFIRRISQPLSALSGYASKLAAKDFSAELHVSSSDEIGLLANTMKDMARDLNKSYEELEAKVQERTAELSVAKGSAEQSLAQLQQAQKQLVETEKMAALGGLVAGIAHEINTPVGVGITAATHLQGKLEDLVKEFRAGAMKKSDLEKFFDMSTETIGITILNMNRAAELIASFKQVAVDQSSDDRRRFNLKKYLDEVLLSLKHEYKRTKHRIEVLGADDVEVDTCPGALSQIATNLLMNSLIHAYDKDDEGHIVFNITRSNGTAVLTYSDNGKGIPKENLPRIFEPFFTTRRGKGGSGLGMHIVYNLVNGKLNGKITCESEVAKGTTFHIAFPTNMGG